MKTLTLIAIVIGIAACKPESPTSPRENSVSNPTPLVKSVPLHITSPVGTVDFMAGVGQDLRFIVDSGDVSAEQLVSDDTEHDYFLTSGPHSYFAPHKAFYLWVYPRRPTPGPVSIVRKVHIGTQTFDIPLTIAVRTYSYISTFSTNTPNDTIVLSKVDTFDLHVTCFDSLGGIVTPAAVIGTNVVYTNSAHFDGTDWPIAIQPQTSNGNSFDFRFWVWPDATPSAYDASLRFDFHVGDKVVSRPIKINY